MTDLIDRGLFLVIGLGLGFILGRMTRSQLRIEKGLSHVEQLVEKDRNENGFMEIRYVKDVLYILVLIITLMGVVRAESALDAARDRAEADEQARCEAGVANRDALRGIVEAVYTLATGSVERRKNDPPLTDEEVVRYNAYIDRVNLFRKETYDLIRPSEVCAPYVEDDDVDPPTPPFPHVTN